MSKYKLSINDNSYLKGIILLAYAAEDIKSLNSVRLEIYYNSNRRLYAAEGSRLYVYLGRSCLKSTLILWVFKFIV